MLHINQTDYSGFEITFSNGWKASVQFGPGTLSDNQSETGYHDSNTAEIRAWNNANISYTFEDVNNTTIGFVLTDKIVDFLTFIRNQESV
jgi:hypothetical protein